MPLEIESAEYSPFGDARLVVELRGRWLGSPPGGPHEPALLTLDLDGVVHRFPEIAASDEGGAEDGDEYLASFVIPSELEQRLAAPAVLVAAGATVAVPAAARASEPSLPASGGEQLAGGHDPVTSALRAELGERIAAETRLRGELGQLRLQLEARTRNQDKLEATQSELRTALAELKATVEQDALHRVALESSNAALESANASLSAELGSLRAELVAAEQQLEQVRSELTAAHLRARSLEGQLAAAGVARDMLAEEAAELRRELELLGAELAESREHAGSTEMHEAEALLAEARALTASLRGGVDEARD